jgi:ATP-dependent DNA helicase RecQ
MSGHVRAAVANAPWQSGYAEQIAFRRAQIDRVMQFAETPQCRMTALIRHFGDTADAHKPCGHCDFCNPAATTAQSFAEPSAAEDRDLRTILRALAGGVSRPTGRLHTELDLTPDRKEFDALLDGLVRAGLVQYTQDTFTAPDGRVINYKKASLTYEGETLAPGSPLGVTLRESAAAPATRSRSKSGAAAPKPRKAVSTEPKPQLTPAQAILEDSLRVWRKAEAGKTGKPAFIVVTDACLHALVQAQPRTLAQLLQVPGIGPDKAERFGPALIALCTNAEVPGEYGAPAAKPKTAKPTPTPSPAAKPLFSPTHKAQVPHPSQPHRDGWEANPQPALPQPSPASPIKPRPEALGEVFTPDQLALEQRLRDWRKSESERMGLPQFFVLGTSALRSIVLTRPKTIAQLQSIHGIGPEKADKYGASILQACNQL